MGTSVCARSLSPRRSLGHHKRRVATRDSPLAANMSLSAAQVLLLLLPSRSVALGPGVETIPSTAPSPPACGDVSLFHGGLFFAGVFSLNTIARIAIGRDGQVVATSAVNETDNEPRFSNKNMSLECAAMGDVFPAVRPRSQVRRDQRGGLLDLSRDQV